MLSLTFAINTADGQVENLSIGACHADGALVLSPQMIGPLDGFPDGFASSESGEHPLEHLAFEAARVTYDDKADASHTERWCGLGRETTGVGAVISQTQLDLPNMSSTA